MFTVNRQCDEKKQRNDESLTSNLRLSEGLNRVPSRHVARLFFNQMVPELNQLFVGFRLQVSARYLCAAPLQV